MVDAKAIRAKLQRAFRVVQKNEFTRDEMIDLRMHLTRLSKEYVCRYLPLVLDDLLDNHTNDPARPENADFVIYFLNVLGSSEEEIAFESESEANARAASLLKEQRSEVFSDLTPEQIEAIHEWLLFSESWHDLDICRSELASALKFWGGRYESRPALLP